MEATCQLDGVLITSERNIEISRDTMHAIKDSDLEENFVNTNLIEQDASVKAEEHFMSDHVTESKNMPKHQVMKKIPDQTSSTPFEVSSITKIDSERNFIPKSPVTDKATADIEPLQNSHESAEVKELIKTGKVKKKVTIKEKATMDTVDDANNDTIEEFVELNEILGPLKESAPAKEIAFGSIVPKNSTVIVEEMRNSEVGRKENIRKLQHENIARKISGQESIIISEPKEAVHQLESIGVNDTDLPKKLIAEKNYQSKENFAQEQFIPGINESVAVCKGHEENDLKASSDIAPFEPMEYKLQEEMYGTVALKNEVSHKSRKKPCMTLESNITTLCNKSEPNEKESLLNKRTKISFASTKASLADTFDEKAAIHHPIQENEVAVLDMQEKINKTDAYSHGIAKSQEENHPRQEEELFEQKPLVNMPPLNDSYGISKANQEAVIPLVLGENTSLGLIKETLPVDKSLANKSSIEEDSRIEEIVQEVEIASNVKKDSGIYVKATPSREASISRDDSRTVEFSESQKLLLVPSSKKVARRSRSHSKHGVKEAVVEAETITSIPNQNVPPSKISQSRDSSIPRISQVETPLESTRSLPYKNKREHSETRIHETDELANAEQSMNMHGLAVGKQHSERVSRFETKEITPEHYSEESADIIVKSNTPHLVDKTGNLEASNPTTFNNKNEKQFITSGEIKAHNHFATNEEAIHGFVKNMRIDLKSEIPEKSTYIKPSDTLKLEMHGNFGNTISLSQDWKPEIADARVDGMECFNENQTKTLENPETIQVNFPVDAQLEPNIQSENKILAFRDLTFELEIPKHIKELHDQKTNIDINIDPQVPTHEHVASHFENNQSIAGNQIELVKPKSSQENVSKSVVQHMENAMLGSCAQNENLDTVVVAELDMDFTKSLLATQVRTENKVKRIPSEGIKKSHAIRKEERNELAILPRIEDTLHGAAGKLEDQPIKSQSSIEISPHVVTKKEETKSLGTTDTIPSLPNSNAAIKVIEPSNTCAEETTDTSIKVISITSEITEVPEASVLSIESKENCGVKAEEVSKVEVAQAGTFISPNTIKADADIIEAQIMENSSINTPETLSNIHIKEENIEAIPKMTIDVSEASKHSEEIHNENFGLSLKYESLKNESISIDKDSSEAYQRDQTIPQEEVIPSSNNTMTGPKTSIKINSVPIADFIESTSVLAQTNSKKLNTTKSEKDAISLGITEELHVSDRSETTPLEISDKFVSQSTTKSNAISRLAINEEAIVEKNYEVQSNTQQLDSSKVEKENVSVGIVGELLVSNALQTTPQEKPDEIVRKRTDKSKANSRLKFNQEAIVEKNNEIHNSTEQSPKLLAGNKASLIASKGSLEPPSITTLPILSKVQERTESIYPSQKIMSQPLENLQLKEERTIVISLSENQVIITLKIACSHLK